MNHTPLSIEIILRCYYSSEPSDAMSSPAGINTVISLVSQGVLEVNDTGGHSCTHKGLAFIRMLLGTPFPVEQLVDPRTSEVIGEEPWKGSGKAPRCKACLLPLPAGMRCETFGCAGGEVAYES